MKKALILSLILGSSVVLLPSFETRAATVSAFNAEPQIIIQTRRSRRSYRSYNRRNNRWNERRNQRSYWGWRNRYYNRGRVVNRTRISRYGYPTIYRNRTRVRRNWRNY